MIKQPSETEIHPNTENYTCDPFKYTIGINMYQYVWENQSEYKGLKPGNTHISLSSYRD